MPASSKDEFVRRVTKLVAAATTATVNAHGEALPSSVGKRAATDLWAQLQAGQPLRKILEEEPMPSPKIQFRTDGQTHKPLEARAQEGNLNLTAQRDLGRYYTVLINTEAELQDTFTLDEWCAIADANSGTFWDALSLSMVWRNIEDSPGLDEKWGVDQSRLIRKLQGLTAAQKVCVVDVCERFWLEPNQPFTFPGGLVYPVSVRSQNGKA